MATGFKAVYQDRRIVRITTLSEQREENDLSHFSPARRLEMMWPLRLDA